MTDAISPITLPNDAAGWTEFVTQRPDDFLAQAHATIAALKDGAQRSAADVLEQWNEIAYALRSAGSASYVLSECHPDPDVRAAASERYLAAAAVETSLSLDRELWDVLSAVDPAGLDAQQQRLLEHALRDFRLSGVNLDDAGRERARQLADRDSELSVEFNKNIRDGRRSMRVGPDALAGMPQDFLDEHPVDEEGLITLTTDYPDLMPVRDYATNRDTRIAMTAMQNDLAWPENDAVLRELLQVRQERAHLLGFGDWSDVETANRMAASSANVATFLEQVDAASAAAAAPEYETMLTRLRMDVPDVAAVTTADFPYLLGAIKREQYEVDAQVVRSYFAFPKVLQGVLDLTGELLGLQYRPVDVPTWHTDVHTYDVHTRVDGSGAAAGERIGRIYLDLHPREGKFNHAACFDLAGGIAGRELAESILLCNFTRGYMEHDEVTTFLHEFGHLVHGILAGHQRYVAQTGIATEWDFVEAPSQMLEEWAWDADVLARFATNDAGEAIPAQLVAAMRRADGFGRALSIRRQLGLTRVSYNLHVEVPDDITAATDRWLNESTPVRTLENSHFACGFGHLAGYGAAYYTYQWSLVIARDLLTAFADDIMSVDVASRYRQLVLEPGGTKDAADLVADFLGREYNFAAYADWLASK